MHWLQKGDRNIKYFQEHVRKKKYFQEHATEKKNKLNKLIMDDGSRAMSSLTMYNQRLILI